VPWNFGGRRTEADGRSVTGGRQGRGMVRTATYTGPDRNAGHAACVRPRAGSVSETGPGPPPTLNGGGPGLRSGSARARRSPLAG